VAITAAVEDFMLSNAHRLLVAPGALFPLAALAACSAQAGTSYPGEPLATLTGTVQTASEDQSPSPAPMDAALVWASVQFSPSEQLIQSVHWVGESAPVSGQFPATFTLNVYQPPPDSALIACPSSSAHIAVAFIVAVPAGTDVTSADLAGASGEAYDSMVLYLDSDEPSGWSCLANMGFTYAPTKGFHLMTEVPNSIEARAVGACYPAYVEASAGLSTPITLTLSPLTSGPTLRARRTYACPSANRRRRTAEPRAPRRRPTVRCSAPSRRHRTRSRASTRATARA
jgi:hypothetical protein